MVHELDACEGRYLHIPKTASSQLHDYSFTVLVSAKIAVKCSQCPEMSLDGANSQHVRSLSDETVPPKLRAYVDLPWRPSAISCN